MTGRRLSRRFNLFFMSVASTSFRPFPSGLSSSAAPKASSEESFSELVNVFRDFLNSQNVWNEGRNYREKIASIVSLEKRRLIVNLNDIRSFSPQLAKE